MQTEKVNNRETGLSAMQISHADLLAQWAASVSLRLGCWKESKSLGERVGMLKSSLDAGK